MKTKEKVLKLLQEAGNDYISGEEMAAKLNVTRAGIWKAVKTLQDNGIEIEAITNRGYRLLSPNDAIEAEWIEEKLRERGIDISVFYFDEVTSTNDVVVKLGYENSGVVLAIAGKQTNGRGRRGRDFYSPKDTGIYMSLLFRGNEPVEQLAGLTSTIAVAVAKGIDKAAFNDRDIAKIKWVNDIYIGSRKISGTITELSTNLEAPSQHSIVMGIGINVYVPKEDFPEELKNKAGALETTGLSTEDHLRNRIILEVIANLFHYRKDKEETLKIYREKSNLIGHYVKINSFSERVNDNYALVTGISDDFHLEVRYDDGREDSLSSGEVSVVKY